MDYKNGKIYTIRSHQTDQIYIGSTTQPLSKRLYEHRKKYKKYITGEHYYISSFDILQYEDAYIELLEEYPCENKMMLEKREGELMRDNNCVNKYIAGRTRKEYYQDNKDKIKEYYQDNKDKIKEYTEENKDKINEYKKKYREENKDKINEYKKKYREENKDKIKEHNKKYKDKCKIIMVL
jgi:hypothetical protein